MTIISNDISQAVKILENGDVIGLPTETVYGLAGNIYNENAIKKIFTIKQRPLFNPLIVHIHSEQQLKEIVTDFPPKAQKLAKKFWPGPLTLLLKKNSQVPDLVTAGKDTVAVRIPNHPVALDLLRKVPFPLAAPSANPFNRISPTQASHVEDYFQETLSLVLEGGACKNGIESTIVGFDSDKVIIYRLGSISVEEIESIVGKTQIKNKKEVAPTAPGMLEKHYSPKTKTYFVSDIKSFIETQASKKIGVLLFTGDIHHPNVCRVEILSASGNLFEATANLYSALHKLDCLDLDVIVAQKCPEIRLGKSINDRLERASK